MTVEELIKERIKNYKELHKLKMKGALDKWEAMVELDLALKEEKNENKN